VYCGAAALRVLPSDIALRVLPSILLNAHSGSWYKLTTRVKVILAVGSEWGILDNLIAPTQGIVRVPKSLFGGVLLVVWYVVNTVDTLFTHLIDLPINILREWIGQEGLRLVPAGLASRVEALGQPYGFGEQWYTQLFKNGEGLADLDQMFSLMSTNMQLATTATLMELAYSRAPSAVESEGELGPDLEFVLFLEDSGYNSLRDAAMLMKEAYYDRFE
jgi:hypothetical protein